MLSYILGMTPMALFCSCKHDADNNIHKADDRFDNPALKLSLQGLIIVIIAAVTAVTRGTASMTMLMTMTMITGMSLNMHTRTPPADTALSLQQQRLLTAAWSLMSQQMAAPLTVTSRLMVATVPSGRQAAERLRSSMNCLCQPSQQPRHLATHTLMTMTMAATITGATVMAASTCAVLSSMSLVTFCRVLVLPLLAV